MKKNLLLLALLAGLVAGAVVYQQSQNKVLNKGATTGTKLREYLLPDLKPDDVRKIRIKDEKGEVTVTLTDDLKTATVEERGNYAAAKERIGNILNELKDQRIASKVLVKKGAWADIQVQPPGEGNTGVGTQVELFAAGGKLLRSFVLGISPGTSGGQTSTPMSGGSQRYVRIPEDGETIWTVSNTFFDLEAKPDAWLDKSFIDIQKIKEISVVAPKAEDSWKVSRASDTALDYVLEGAKPGELVDSSKLPMGNILASPSFNDVVVKDKAAEVLKGASKARITTFDGYVYDIQVAKQSKDGADKYFMSVSVTGDFPKTRTPAKDEKEEDKKKADEEFAAALKAKEDKLTKEQRFVGWAFEVSEYIVNNLLKKRSELLKPAGAAPSGGTAPGSAAGSDLIPTPQIPGLTPPPAAPSAPSPIMRAPEAAAPAPAPAAPAQSESAPAKPAAPEAKPAPAPAPEKSPEPEAKPAASAPASEPAKPAEPAAPPAPAAPEAKPAVAAPAAEAPKADAPAPAKEGGGEKK